QEHRVEVTTKLDFGAHEVTQQEWRVFTNNNPSQNQCNDCPVENVTWWEALQFANAASKKANYQQCYQLKGCNKDETEMGTGTACGSVQPPSSECKGYRLPTEAEWNQAAEWNKAANSQSSLANEKPVCAESKTH